MKNEPPIEPSLGLKVAGVLVFLAGAAMIGAGEFELLPRESSWPYLIGGGLIGLGGILYLRGRGTRGT